MINFNLFVIYSSKKKKWFNRYEGLFYKCEHKGEKILLLYLNLIHKILAF